MVSFDNEMLYSIRIIFAFGNNFNLFRSQIYIFLSVLEQYHIVEYFLYY